MNVRTEEKENETKEMTRAEFINKASYCDFNHLWKCKHKEQRGRACTEICQYYQNTHE